MPSNETSFLNQTAVYWPFIGYDPNGQPVVGSPIELSPSTCPPTGVRWLTKRREVVAPDGNTIALDATVTLSAPIKMNSHIWLGTLSEWYGPVGTGSGSGSGATDDELMEVKLVQITPDVKQRNQLVTAGLMRLHNSNGP